MSFFQIKECETDTRTVRVYNDIETAIRIAQEGGVWKSKRESRTPKSDWNGASWDEAIDMARFGWREGGKLVRKAFCNLPAPMLSAGSSYRHDYYGERCDMARFSAGEDMCFRTRSGADRGRQRMVRIVVPMGFPCSTASDRVVNRGSAIISVVDALEMTRRTVELVCAYSSTSSGSREPTNGYHMNQSIVIKKAGEAFDIDRMAIFLAHRASLRKIGFALMETSKLAEDSHKNGYGYGCNIHPDNCSPMSIALPELHGGDWNTPEDARETLANIIREAGHQLVFRS